jgi:membrane protein required for colicin V production
MTMYDWAIIVVAVGFIVRGWRRGLAREAIDVGLLLLGSLVVFRMSPVLGTIISGMANIPYEVGRVVAGAVVFVALVAAAIVLGRMLATAMRVVPVVTTLNRLAGSAVGLVFAAVVVVVGTTLVSAAPVPGSMRGPLDRSVEGSAIGTFVVDPEGPIRPIVATASGDDLFGTVIAVRRAVGDRLMAGTIPVPFPAVIDGDLTPSQADAQAVFDELNRERISAGLDPLAWSPDLAIVSVSRASDVYRSGWLALDDRLPSALTAAGVPGTIHGEMVVMAASVDGLVEATVDAPAYEAMLEDATYRKAGIGVIDGPYGLIAVQVLSG